MTVDYDRVIERLVNAQRVAVLSGAGISEESGIPTFRDPQTGLWAQYDPMVLATAEAFSRDPKLVWEWYEWRRGLRRDVQPNPGHFALAEIGSRIPHFTVITQNTDGLHQRAGSPDVIELHGNMVRNICSKEKTVVDRADAQPEGNGMLRCPHCGEYLRPDVVWFGESLPPRALERAIAESRASDVFMSIGTSAVVEPAASLPKIARYGGAFLVEINPLETPLSPLADVKLAGKSGAILPELARRFREAQTR